MARIISVGKGIANYSVAQSDAMEFARRLFADSVKDIDRLLKVFKNGEIEKRHFVKPLDWYNQNHSFSKKNDTFIELAVQLSIEAINECLQPSQFKDPISFDEIEAIIMVCTSGLATPSLDARIMNALPFSQHTKRIPIWGLGCAGSVAGLSRAYEYCKAFPEAKVLVVAVELCSLTFQKADLSKSNLIGTSLFADGAAAVLIAGNEVKQLRQVEEKSPAIIDTQSTLLRDSLDVMGWDVKDNGLYVIFSKSIPSLVESWLQQNVASFLAKHDLKVDDIGKMIAHPGGKKVITAYEKALGLDSNQTRTSLSILKQYGNMSSVTVLYVLAQTMSENVQTGQYGLMTALGPGFSSELLLLRWE